MRYADEGERRSHLYIVHVVHGARDLDAYLSQREGDEAGR
jgi:hypothetical protein